MTTADMDDDGDPDLLYDQLVPDALMWVANELDGISTAVASPTLNEIGLRCAPVPFSTFTRLSADKPINEDAAVEIIDAHGRQMRTTTGNGTREMMIERGSLAPGIYLVRLTSDSGLYGTTRLVVE